MRLLYASEVIMFERDYSNSEVLLNEVYIF